MAEKASTTKTCNACNLDLPTSLFYPHKGSADGISYWCKDCSRLYKARWRDLNRETYREKQKKRVRNPEKMRAAQRKWREAHRDLANARIEDWNSRNKERRARVRRLWKDANPEKVASYWATRRAKMVNAEGCGWTADDVAAVKKAQRSKCAFCTMKLPKRFHRDHIMPLKLGGLHDRANLQLLCEPCNLRKGAKHPADHARSLGLLI